MKRVLVVSPTFPPATGADVHRVRMSLGSYREWGWEPFVLAVDAAAHGGLQDADLMATIPSDVPVIRCGAIPTALTQPFGIRTAGLRALPQLYAAGARLIRREAIDLVYFSTTMFPCVTLGRLWKARVGTPFVVDMQDPWSPDAAAAAGGEGWKARAARWLHARLEPFAMRAVDGVISVSPAYSATLQRRYPSIRPEMCATIPFGLRAGDLDAARQLVWSNPFFDRADGRLHGVSVGRGGGDLRRAAAILFRAVRARDAADGVPGRLQLSFIGTDYAVRDPRRTMAPVAAMEAAAAIVREYPARVPYLHGLRVIRDAHFSVLLGSEDPGYSPSKVYPALLCGRPFVAVLHEASPIVPWLRETGMGVVATFGDGEDVSAAVARLSAELTWVVARAGAELALPSSMLEAVSARELTRRQCESFDAAMQHAAPKGESCAA